MVSKIINESGCGAFQVYLYFVCGLCFTQEASILSIEAYWSLSSFEKSAINASIFAGISVGYLFWGLLGDRFGRKLIIMVMCFDMLLFASLAAVSPHFWVFLGCVFVIGIGGGASGIPLTYFSEFLPRKSRGTCVQFLALWWSSGVIYESLISFVYYSNERNQTDPSCWRLFIMFSVVPFICQLFLLPQIPESMRYLSVNRENERIEEIKDNILEWNCQGIEHPLDEELIHKQSLNPEQERETKKRRGSVFDLCSKKIFFLWLNIMVIWSSTAFIYYSCLQSTPNFFTDNYRYLGTLIATLAEIPGIVIPAILLNFIGRRTILYTNLFLCAVFFILLQITFESFIFRVVVVFIIRATIMGANSVVWILAQETLPSNVRTTGIGVINFVSKLFTILSPYLANMLGKKHERIKLVIYCVISLTASFLAFVHPHETKGRDMVEVVDELN